VYNQSYAEYDDCPSKNTRRASLKVQHSPTGHNAIKLWAAQVCYCVHISETTYMLAPRARQSVRCMYNSPRRNPMSGNVNRSITTTRVILVNCLKRWSRGEDFVLPTVTFIIGVSTQSVDVKIDRKSLTTYVRTYVRMAHLQWVAAQWRTSRFAKLIKFDIELVARY